MLFYKVYLKIQEEVYNFSASMLDRDEILKDIDILTELLLSLITTNKRVDPTFGKGL